MSAFEEENEHLKRGLLGQEAERLPKNDAQLSLAILDLGLGAEADAKADAAGGGSKRETGARNCRTPSA